MIADPAGRAAGRGRVTDTGSGSAAADFRDQHDLAVGVERRLLGVLVDFAVDRDRHPLVDLVPEPGKAAVELGDHAAHRVRLDLELGLPPVNRRAAMPARTTRGIGAQPDPLSRIAGRG